MERLVPLPRPIEILSFSTALSDFCHADEPSMNAALTLVHIP